MVNIGNGKETFLLTNVLYVSKAIGISLASIADHSFRIVINNAEAYEYRKPSKKLLPGFQKNGIFIANMECIRNMELKQMCTQLNQRKKL